MLVDTHCHLNFDTFDQDRQLVIDRARQAGLDCMLNPGIDLASSFDVVQLSETYAEIAAAVGIHPNDALSWKTDTLRILRQLIQHRKVVAIGEIGLDYYRDRAPEDIQRQVFRQQLDLAGEACLPVIIHMRNASKDDRRASADVLAILSEWYAELKRAGSPLLEHPGVLHSFSDDKDCALRATMLNFYIGITGPVTFRNVPELQEVVMTVSLERILVETDAPFLTPHPHRGNRNEPAYVKYVVEKIAQIRGLSFETVAKMTFDNAKRLFNWQSIN